MKVSDCCKAELYQWTKKIFCCCKCGDECTPIDKTDEVEEKRAIVCASTDCKSVIPRYSDSLYCSKHWHEETPEPTEAEQVDVEQVFNDVLAGKIKVNKIEFTDVGAIGELYFKDHKDRGVIEEIIESYASLAIQEREKEIVKELEKRVLGWTQMLDKPEMDEHTLLGAIEETKQIINLIQSKS